MSKSDSRTQKKEKQKNTKWVIIIFLVTIIVSGVISLASESVMQGSNIFVAFVILLLIILIGIVFDIIGMAVATADEKPFHAMAAKKVTGAKESIRLLRNAERVSSICNDVVGDICGVVSGAASATIAAQIIANFEFSWPDVVSLALSSLAAALTVGGKAIGKGIAVNSCTQIVYRVGQIIHFLNNIGSCFKPKKNKK